MVTSKPSVAIVGLNVGVNGHIPAFKKEGWDVLALGATTQEKLDKASADHGIAANYTDFDRLLQHPGLDAVVIASPPSTHLDMTLKALDAGKHVLIEKPFALNAKDGAVMRDRARAAGKTTMIAEAYRFAPSRAYAKELIEQGYIGKLQTVAMTVFLGPRQRPEPAGPRLHWRSSNSTGGGFSAGPASTFFDSVLDWFGDVTRVQGKVYQAHLGQSQPDGSPADADESMAVHFELAGGAWGTLTASMTTPFGQGAIFDMMGSEGTLRLTQNGLLPLASDTVSGGRFDDGPEVKKLEIPQRFFETVTDESPKPEPYHAYQAVVRAFAKGIQDGTSPEPNFEDAYKLQRITDAVRESSASGGWVKI
jgi:predicted dehydrogenase